MAEAMLKMRTAAQAAVAASVAATKTGAPSKKRKRCEAKRNFFFNRFEQIAPSTFVAVCYDSTVGYRTQVRLMKTASPRKCEFILDARTWMDISAHLDLMEHFFYGAPIIEFSDVIAAAGGYTVKFDGLNKLVKISRGSREAPCFALDATAWINCRRAFPLIDNLVRLYTGLEPKLNRIVEELAVAVTGDPRWPLSHSIKDLSIDLSGYPELNDANFVGLIDAVKFCCADDIMARTLA